MAEENHIRRLPLPAPRGVLLDRDGKVLVENRDSYSIALVREQTRNLDETLNVLAFATGTDEAQLRETVARRRREPSYRPIVLIENASFPQAVAVQARQWELPGIIVQHVPSRHYPRARWRRTVRLRQRDRGDTAAESGIRRRRGRERWSGRRVLSSPTTSC
jgi:penicillin-binding protein 2